MPPRSRRRSRACSLLSDTRPPEQAADEWAGDNVNGVNVGPTNIVQIANCDGGSAAPNGYVSVRYQAPQDLFFAPVLGYPDTGTVSTEATAIWGPPGAANPIPIVIYSSELQQLPARHGSDARLPVLRLGGQQQHDRCPVRVRPPRPADR